jgi:flagellar hook-length control protein FliK
MNLAPQTLLNLQAIPEGIGAGLIGVKEATSLATPLSSGFSQFLGQVLSDKTLLQIDKTSDGSAKMNFDAIAQLAGGVSLINPQFNLIDSASLTSENQEAGQIASAQTNKPIIDQGVILDAISREDKSPSLYPISTSPQPASADKAVPTIGLKLQSPLVSGPMSEQSAAFLLNSNIGRPIVDPMGAHLLNGKLPMALSSDPMIGSTELNSDISNLTNKNQATTIFNNLSNSASTINMVENTFAKAVAFKTNLTPVFNSANDNDLINNLADSLNIKTVETGDAGLKSQISNQSNPSITAPASGNPALTPELDQSLMDYVNPKSDKQTTLKISGKGGGSSELLSGNDTTIPSVPVNPAGNTNTEYSNSALKNSDLTDIASQPALLKGNSEKLTAVSINDQLKMQNGTIKAESAAVKFILPTEGARTNLKSGQTIIIKMEPESLGSVRLTLTNSNDMLTGRLIVENSAARTMVESSLNNLYDQLARQGIRLDAFEVSLSGDQSGYRFTQDKSFENLKNQYGERDSRSGTGEIIQSPENISPNRGYINAAGVDWIV